MDEVCRICQEKGTQYKEIENILQDYLDDLLISLDTAVFQKSIVCKKCVAHIHELFDFKTLCLNTENALLPYIEENSSNVVQLDLRSVYSKIKLRQFPESEENADICRLCFKITTQWVPLETAISQTNVRDAFENNLPEISLQAIKRPAICEYCLKMLNILYIFTSNCKSSINMMMNESVENITVETVIDSKEANDDDNKVKIEIQLDNHVENQVQKLPADEVEIQFGKRLDNECKIEINENPIDYVGNNVERFVQTIMDSESYIKEETNCDISGIEEFDLTNTAPRDTLWTNPPLENSKEPISCDNCLNVYFNHVDLAIHSITHSENGMYICHVCKNYANADKNHILMHIRAHERGENEVRCNSSDDSDSPTEHCEETKKSRTRKKPSQKRKYKGERSHVCDQCGKGYDRKLHLDVHMRTHTGEKPYVCSHCGKGFNRKETLVSHLRTHTGDKPHICEHCGRGFSEKSNLTCHMRIYTEKPYVCGECGKRFTERAILNSHQRTHMEEKPHICSHCGKGFSRRDILISHLRTHTGEKPFICAHCGRGFSVKSHLNRHLPTHTGKKLHNGP